MEDVMRVAIVGGLERSDQHYRAVAEEAGFDAVFHTGHVGGRGRAALAQVVDGSDIVLIVTDVNSHGAVQFARRRMRVRGRTPILVRKCGLNKFAELLKELRERPTTTAAAAHG
jgi:hypothetical protein